MVKTIQTQWKNSPTTNYAIVSSKLHQTASEEQRSTGGVSSVNRVTQKTCIKQQTLDLYWSFIEHLIQGIVLCSNFIKLSTDFLHLVLTKADVV